MPPTGVEPVLCLQKGILSPSCLPISPQRRKPGLQSPAALDIHREPGITGDELNIYHKSVVTELQTCIKTCKIHTTAIIIQ